MRSACPVAMHVYRTLFSLSCKEKCDSSSFHALIVVAPNALNID